MRSPKALDPKRLARASSHHPWRVIAVWVALLVAAGVLSSLFLSRALTTRYSFENKPESQRAQDLIQQMTGPQKDTEIFIVSSATYAATSPQFYAYMSQLQSGLVALGRNVVTSVTNPLQLIREAGASPQANLPTAAPRTMISQDGHTVLMSVVMTGSLDQAGNHAIDLQNVIHGSSANPDFKVLVFGQATQTLDFRNVSQQDLQRGEAIGILIALLVLVFVFAAVVAALVPVIMGIFAIAIATGVVALLGLHFRFTFFVPEMMSMMGLAVGIDYSLFIVSRYREERRRGRDKLEAIAAAGGTASRAVFFSGLTVVVALLGMIIIPTSMFRGLATGAIIVVLISVLASLTLLPALLALLGDRINWPRLSRRARTERPEATEGFWDRATRVVMGHPAISLVLASALLVALALPSFSIKTGLSGIGDSPNSMESKQAFIALSKDFSGGLAAPVEIVISGNVNTPRVQAAVQTLDGLLAKDPSFGPASPVQANGSGGLAVVSVPLSGDIASPSSMAAVGRVRSDYVPKAFAGTGVQVLVGGQTAFMKDFIGITSSYTPWIFMFVLGLSFVLLTVVFRSIVVPIKAIVMNLLSVGAAYGSIVLVFQHGVGLGLFGSLGWHFHRIPVIDAWLPLFLFSILFGLSMDYHVFLLSRIREQYDGTGDNAGSVAFGLRTTGAIITGAALIMVAVFSGFARGELTPLQEMGFGLAVAVFLDATVVRSVLVPAAMRLLGDRNWYLPRWLQWLPKLNAEGDEAARAAEAHEAQDAQDVEPVGSVGGRE